MKENPWILALLTPDGDRLFIRMGYQAKWCFSWGQTEILKVAYYTRETHHHDGTPAPEGCWYLGIYLIDEHGLIGKPGEEFCAATQLVNPRRVNDVALIRIAA